MGDGKSVKRWTLYLGVPAALAASIAGVLALTGYAGAGAWLLVQDAAAQQVDTKIEIKHKAHDLEPHVGAATSVQMEQTTIQLAQIVTTVSHLAVLVTQSTTAYGADVCRQSGGTAHEEDCLYIRSGRIVATVPLLDMDAMRARTVVSAKVKAAIKAAGAPP